MSFTIIKEMAMITYAQSQNKYCYSYEKIVFIFLLKEKKISF